MHFGKSAPAHLTYATSFDGDLPMPKHSRQYSSSHVSQLIRQYVSCFNLTTWSRWTLKIKTIYSVWIVCWTQGTLNLPPILWLLLVNLPHLDRSSSDTLPPLLWDNETNFAECCVFFLMNNADWMINLLQRISNICCIMTWRWCRLFYSTEWSKCSWTCNSSLLNWNATNDDKCTSPSAA